MAIRKQDITLAKARRRSRYWAVFDSIKWKKIETLLLLDFLSQKFENKRSNAATNDSKMRKNNKFEVDYTNKQLKRF